MNIFITGCSGFVGTNLNSYLLTGHLSVFPINLRGDCSDLVFGKNDAIIHLAGKAHDLKNTSSSDEYYQVNFELTKKIYDVFLKSDAKKFIFMSSVKAVADTVSHVLTEDDFPDPKTHYGKSKLMAEAYIQSQALPNGKSYYILRPCMIHGPGNKGNLNLLYKFVQRGIPYPFAAFENKRSFLSVENLCYIIVSLLRKDAPSGIYHIADDEVLSTNEVVRILATSTDKKPKLWEISSNLIKNLAKLGDIFKLPLNTERLKKLTESYVVSNKKIMEELGIQLPLTASEGLKRTAESFKKWRNENNG